MFETMTHLSSDSEPAVSHPDHLDSCLTELTGTARKQTPDIWTSTQTNDLWEKTVPNATTVFFILWSQKCKLPSVPVGRINPPIVIKYGLSVLCGLIMCSSDVQKNPSGARNTETAQQKDMRHTSHLLFSRLHLRGNEKQIRIMPGKIRCLPLLGGLVKATGIPNASPAFWCWSLTIFSNCECEKNEDGAKTVNPSPRDGHFVQSNNLCFLHMFW